MIVCGLLIFVIVMWSFNLCDSMWSFNLCDSMWSFNVLLLKIQFYLYMYMYCCWRSSFIYICIAVEDPVLFIHVYVLLLKIQFYLYMYCRWRSSFQEQQVGILLTCLTPPHLCACPKPGPGFPTSYVMVFFVFRVNESLIVRFVDIGRIVDHHGLNFLLIR